ncbi:hypothetical protein [Pseudogemmobacter faecipullorum]|uniref:Uncharacterized protein n=1 Tax=Pseudogemmobacter faecipullorum TaxID=2755041 RepID=A0ABS8CLP8_9RHOB|nr:hypothetical protein [Pseudogemmobacter faecipullorum]MCB5410305.1 hypothetical protein [Pseudogemmobacter faecipullorum]
MTSRRYVKRIWRVPKDRGALEYFATLVVKALVKHGWPAKWEPVLTTNGFEIQSHDHGNNLPPDFLHAAEMAVRITARTYRVDVASYGNVYELARNYEVTKGGHFKEVKH